MMVISAILLPAWGLLAVAFCGLILFNKFYEAILGGFWFDLLYGSSSLGSTKIFYLTFATILMFVMVNFLKQIIYTYAQI